MIRNSSFSILLLIIILFVCCKRESTTPDGSLIAFSLREAQQLLMLNHENVDSSLITLGGITRLAGMVIDRDNNDIILIGKKSNELPRANFNDLVVAIRSRMVYDELPMVSIDPAENTAVNRKQEVRFSGHIENTSFGNDFLNCDILLKKYSLELAQQIQGVNSYKKLLLDNELLALSQNGIKPISIKWVNTDSIGGYKGDSIESENTNQARFWFNYTKTSKARVLGDVFCILAADVVVEKEVQLINYHADKQNFNINTTSPDELFAAAFSNNFQMLSEAYPFLKKMKLLFDMTAIAEGLRQTKDLPELQFLLNEYQVKQEKTRTDFELIEQCAIIERSDGKTSLIQLSGGIESDVEIEWLNAGNVSYLKKFVMESRPDKNSLYWRIPVDNWEMPNSAGLKSEKSITRKNSKSGCSVYLDKIVLTPNMKSDKGFSGFSPIQVSEPYNTKGVQMNMLIDKESFKLDTSLNSITDTILKNRPNKNSKYWKISTGVKK